MGEIGARTVRLCSNHGPTTNYDTNLNCLECGEHTREEVDTTDRALSPYAAKGSEMEETQTALVSKKRMCLQYQKEIAGDSRICPYCGTNIGEGKVTVCTITGVAAAGGVIGIHGLGHMLLGQITKGFIVLSGGLLLIAGVIISVIMAIDLWEDVYIIIAAILSIAYIALFVWQVIDVNTIARKHNLNLENHRVQ